VAFVYHFFGQYIRYGHNAWKNIFSVCAAVVVPMGLSAHLSVAAFKGLGGRQAVFVRTPKAGTQARGKVRSVAESFSFKAAAFIGIEMILAAYFALSSMVAYHHHCKGNAFIMILFAFGFGYVSALSWGCRYIRSPFIAKAKESGPLIFVDAGLKLRII